MTKTHVRPASELRIHSLHPCTCNVCVCARVRARARVYVCVYGLWHDTHTHTQTHTPTQDGRRTPRRMALSASAKRIARRLCAYGTPSVSTRRAVQVKPPSWVFRRSPCAPAFALCIDDQCMSGRAKQRLQRKGITNSKDDKRLVHKNAEEIERVSSSFCCRAQGPVESLVYSFEDRAVVACVGSHQSSVFQVALRCCMLERAAR